MQKLFKIFSGILVLFLLFIAVWIGFNRWPREGQPPLWTMKDLEVPQKAEKKLNGYDYLMQISSDTKQSYDRMLDDAPDNVRFFFEVSSSTENSQYWDQAKAESSALSEFLKSHQHYAIAHQKLLEYPYFLDQDDPTLPNDLPTNLRMTFLAFSRFGALSALELALNGDAPAAYRLWLKMFKTDVSYLTSARQSMSYFVAMSAVYGDLVLLSRMLAFPPSKECPADVQEALKNFNLAMLDFRRALIFDYLRYYNMANEMFLGMSKSASPGRLVFNKVIYLREMNQFFNQLATLWEDPQAMKAFQEAKSAERKRLYEDPEMLMEEARWWWWFAFNPAKKVWDLHLASSRVTLPASFESQKQDIIELRSRLLQSTSCGPPP